MAGDSAPAPVLAPSPVRLPTPDSRLPTPSPRSCPISQPPQSVAYQSGSSPPFATRSPTTAACRLAITVNFAATDPPPSRQEIACDFAATAPTTLAPLCDAAPLALATPSTRSAPVSPFADLQHWTTSAAPALGLTQ